MELLDQVVNAVVVGAVGFFVWLGTRGRFKALEQRMLDRFMEVDRRFDQVDRRFEQVDQRFDDVNQHFDQVNQRFSELGRDLGAVRSDLTRVALAVGAQPPSERGAG